jgi:hypothetical protein
MLLKEIVLLVLFYPLFLETLYFFYYKIRPGSISIS